MIERSEADEEFLQRLKSRRLQQEHFEANREQYPFYLTRVELYPDYNIVEYRITDLPKNFGDRLFRDTAHMILYVINFQNEEEAKRTTEEMVRLLNKAYGKEV